MEFSTDNWASQVRKGILELCVLNALREGERYAYELARALASLPDLGMPVGTVYPLLFRLREQGLVTVRVEAMAESPARKYYALTPEGRRMLKQMNAFWISISRHVDRLQDGARP